MSTSLGYLVLFSRCSDTAQLDAADVRHGRAALRRTQQQRRRRQPAERYTRQRGRRGRRGEPTWRVCVGPARQHSLAARLALCLPAASLVGHMTCSHDPLTPRPASRAPAVTCAPLRPPFKQCNLVFPLSSAPSAVERPSASPTEL